MGVTALISRRDKNEFRISLKIRRRINTLDKEGANKASYPSNTSKKERTSGGDKAIWSGLKPVGLLGL